MHGNVALDKPADDRSCTCPVCLKILSSRRGMVSHVNSTHKRAAADVLAPCGIVRCPVCPTMLDTIPSPADAQARSAAYTHFVNSKDEPHQFHCRTGTEPGTYSSVGDATSALCAQVARQVTPGTK